MGELATDPRAIIDRLDDRAQRQRTALLKAWAATEPADPPGTNDLASDRRPKGTHTDPPGAATQSDAHARRRVWHRLLAATRTIGTYTIDRLGHPTTADHEHIASLADIDHHQLPDPDRRQLVHVETTWHIRWQQIVTAVHTEATTHRSGVIIGADNARAIAQDAAPLVDLHGRAATLAVRTLTRPDHPDAPYHPPACDNCDRPLDPRTEAHTTTCILCARRLERLRIAANLCAGSHRPGCLNPLSPEDLDHRRRDCGPCRTWKHRNKPARVELASDGQIAINYRSPEGLTA